MLRGVPGFTVHTEFGTNESVRSVSDRANPTTDLTRVVRLCEVRQSYAYGFVRRFEVLTRFSLPGAR